MMLEYDSKQILNAMLVAINTISYIVSYSYLFNTVDNIIIIVISASYTVYNYVVITDAANFSVKRS